MRARFRQLKFLFHDPALFLVVLLILGFLGLFVVFPLFKVLQNSFYYKGVFTPQYFLEFFSGHRYVIRPFLNSLIVAVLVAGLSTLLGFIFAFADVRANIPGRRIFRWIATLPIISPPFIMALAAILLLGHNGLITFFMRKYFGISWNIYGLPGLILTETFAFFPLSFLIMEGVLGNIDPALEESALDLGASKLRTFLRVTLPLATPGIAGSLLLVFTRSLEDFGNPIIIQGRFPVLTTQIYLAITGMYDVPLGATLSIVLLVPTVLAFVVQRYWLSRKSYISVTGRPSTAGPPRVSKGARWFLFGTVFILSSFILLFYGMVIFGSFTKLWGIDNSLTLDNYRYVFTVGIQYLSNSLKLAAIATGIGGLLGITVAYIVTRKRIMLQGLMDFLAMVNFAVPGIVIGIGYILAFNTPPIQLTGTAAIIILIFISQRMPVVVRDGVAMLQQLDPVIDEASSDLGAGFFRTFTRIVLPLVSPALIAGMAYMFAACITSISAVVMVVSPKWYLVTVALLSQVDIGALSIAAAYGTVIILVVLGAIISMDIVVKSLLQRGFSRLGK